ncbi:MAG: ankyrin repeat domain-containing protein [Deltaproteobacteria bacterium]|nr:ankyrin repeat domain-containing protein [Deltaproteobacteria bacterium]
MPEVLVEGLQSGGDLLRAIGGKESEGHRSRRSNAVGKAKASGGNRMGTVITIVVLLVVVSAIVKWVVGLGGGLDVEARLADSEARLGALRERNRKVEAVARRSIELKHAREGDPSALWAAAAGGDLECVKLGLDSGFEIDQADDDGWTMLHYASSGGHSQVVRELLGRGAKARRRCDSGLPIEMAERRGHDEVVALLRAAG